MTEQTVPIETGNCLACGRSLSEAEASGIDWVHPQGNARIYRCVCGAHTPRPLSKEERDTYQSRVAQQWTSPDPPARLAETVPETEVFRCVECRQWVPVQYRSNLTPYGVEGPVCSMCVSYWEYLQGDPDNEEWDEENGYDD